MKVAVITGSRAEYGLLFPLMKLLRADDFFRLQTVVTGMHLSPEFGLTYKEIEADGFEIERKIEMLLSGDSDAAITKSIGLGMIGFADAFEQLKPNLIVLLGDRFETFAAATAGYLAKIPIAHLHGGETTEGATDEALRHAITKMSHLHFTSAEEYRNRVIQLGESPERVFNVGAIGLDNIKSLELLSREELSNQLGHDFNKATVLVTYHPVTLEKNTAEAQIAELLHALDKFPDLKIIFTLPNADADGRIIIKKIEEYVQANENRAKSFTSLGQLRYLSVLQFVKAAIGNSSSGILEVPSFKIPTINIGDRQTGRIKPESVIDAANDKKSIIEAVKRALSKDFQAICEKTSNPYGDGQAANRILQILKRFNNINSLKKTFYDLQ